MLPSDSSERVRAARRIARTFCIPNRLVPQFSEHLEIVEDAFRANNRPKPPQAPLEELKKAHSAAKRLVALLDDDMVTALRCRCPPPRDADAEASYEEFWSVHTEVTRARSALQALEARLRLACDFRKQPGPPRDDLKRNCALYFYAAWILLPKVKKEEWKAGTEWTRAKGARSRAIHARGSLSPAVEFIVECMEAIGAKIAHETVEEYEFTFEEARELAGHLFIEWTS